MSIAPEERAYCERLASLSGWQIAKDLGLGYSGDCNAIDHGGFFYNPTHWDDWGYAEIVQFTPDGDWEGNRLRVERGTINRPDDLDAVFAQSGIDPEERGNIHAQIEAVRYHNGAEWDDRDSGFRLYNPDLWAEWRLWRSILPMLRSIAPQKETPR